MPGVVSLCRSCVHDRTGVCAAYSQGIPDEILLSAADHRLPRGDEDLSPFPDGEPVVWALREGGDEEFARWLEDRRWMAEVLADEELQARGAWPAEQSRAAMQQYAETFGLAVISGVPVTGPNWAGWGPSANERTVCVAVGEPGSGPGTLEPYDGDDMSLRRRFAAGPVRPILRWGYLDRTGFGRIVTRAAFLRRSWDLEVPLVPVALVRPGKAHSNVAGAFVAAGIEIFELSGTSSASRRPGGAAGFKRDPWNDPQPGEDHLLRALWERRERQGWWLAEVPVGWREAPTDRSARRIDAVRVDWKDSRTSAAGMDLAEFAAHLDEGVTVELIEVKAVLNADVIGQLLSGRLMFEQSNRTVGGITLTACVRQGNDEPLHWFCEAHGIAVEVVEHRSRL